MMNSTRGLLGSAPSKCLRRFVLTFALLGLMTLSAQSAVAQDPGADPAYGDVSLEEGFVPDPDETSLTAGGSIEVDKGRCSYGYVANAPDVDLYYTTSGGSNLYIYVRSGEDTTLLINTPDGSWRCDDDGLGDMNPVVIFRNAPSGLYDIWVGTYGDDLASATVYISEIDPR